MEALGTEAQGPGERGGLTLHGAPGLGVPADLGLLGGAGEGGSSLAPVLEVGVLGDARHRSGRNGAGCHRACFGVSDFPKKEE